MRLTQNPTPWFERDVKPVRIGRYEVRNNPAIPDSNPFYKLTIAKFRYWDGKRWLGWKDGDRSVFGKSKAHQWRGLLSDPVFPKSE